MSTRSMTPGQVAELNGRFRDLAPREVVRWALAEYKTAIAFSCGFGLEGVCILDMIAKIDSNAKVFTLDTGRLPQETYDLIQRCKEKYKIDIQVYFPEHREVEEMIRSFGPNLFYESRELRRLCCHVRKVRPLMRALDGLSAWITGLSRAQSSARSAVTIFELDEAHNGILKINPLAYWSSADVWRYIQDNDVPYNALYKRGYKSIGCAPCSRPVMKGEEDRAGRWGWENEGSKECGIHR